MACRKQAVRGLRLFMIPEAPVSVLSGLDLPDLSREAFIRIISLRFVFPVSAGAVSPAVHIFTQNIWTWQFF